MAESCLISTPTLFTTKNQSPFLSLPSKPTKLTHLSILSSPSFPSWVSLKNKSLPFQLVPLVAQTSDWAQQEEGEENQVEKGLSWEGQGLEETVASAASDESEAEGEQEEEEEEESSGDGGEEFYPEPPEEAKLFVGNLSYDVDSEKLAEVFNQAGVVEIAEVKFLFFFSLFICL